MDQPLTTFRVHLSAQRGTAMVPVAVDVTARSPKEAQGRAKAQPGNEDAIVLKTKRVRS